ncbi:tandem-type lipoprotein [Macrococcoides canis]|uniref:tandem-type lipoprotein n=1 Tax=Macrococcoides canis TaxID=1855823 RepID=UPI001AEC0E4A|nr:tandem-type lipoprotein [Macrococcus canis]QTQ07556.1 tandem-type lipoprotein [Macrococcus canis]
MKRYKKLLMIGATVMMVGTGCSNESHIEKENRVQRELNQKPQKKTALDKKVEKSFEKHLSIYPVKSLEDFYDMEGFRDGEFDKDDKGTWVLTSNIYHKKNENAPLISKGIVLYINKNTNITKGKVILKELQHSVNKRNIKEYKINMKNNQLSLSENAPEEIKDFLNEFQFLVEVEPFDRLSDYKKLNSSHNEELPFYTIDYLLPKDNNINKWLQNNYKLSKENAVLRIEKTGDLKGTSLSELNIEIEYPKKDGGQSFYTESILFQPSKSEE